MFDAALALMTELRSLLPTSTVSVSLLIDNKSLFDIFSKGSGTSERRLILDITCAREAFQRQDISYVGFIRSSKSLADGLARRMQQSKLREAIKGSIKMMPEHWIVRNVN